MRIHERRVLFVGLVPRDLDEAGALPGADGALVPGVGVDGHALAAALVEKVRGHGACGVRAEPASACGRDQEHVEPFRMHLEVADGLCRLLHDPRLDILTREPLLHLRAGERLVVPVARDLGIRVPGDETLDVSSRGRPERRQSSAYENVHSTVTDSVAPRDLRPPGEDRMPSRHSIPGCAPLPRS